MARLVVTDTCAIGAALFNEACTANAAPLLTAIRTLAVEAAAPTVFLSEFMNICRKKRLGVQGASPLDASVVDAVLQDAIALPLIWIPIDLQNTQEAWSLHRAMQVETNDAYFLFLAIQWDAELWTTDSRFYAKAYARYHKVYDLNKHPFS